MSATTRKKNRHRMNKLQMEALLEKKEEPIVVDQIECRLSLPADEPIEPEEPLDIPEDLDVLIMPKPRPILSSKEDYDTLHPEETIKEFAKNIRAMLERYEENEKNLIIVEDRLQDIMHGAEMLDDQNIVGGWDIYKQMREARRERRRCKNENDLLQPVYDLFHATSMLDKLGQIQGDCGKIKRSIAAKGYSIRTEVLDDIL